MNFTVPVDYRVKIKENEKRDKYLDLAREFKKLWNMKVTVILVIIVALISIISGLVRELEELEIERQTKTILSTALLRSV